MNKQLKRFENRAQLIRHIATESDKSTTELWNELEGKLNNE